MCQLEASFSGCTGQQSFMKARRCFNLEHDSEKIKICNIDVVEEEGLILITEMFCYAKLHGTKISKEEELGMYTTY